jgi:hypothetical protein
MKLGHSLRFCLNRGHGQSESIARPKGRTPFLISRYLSLSYLNSEELAGNCLPYPDYLVVVPPV